MQSSLTGAHPPSSRATLEHGLAEQPQEVEELDEGDTGGPDGQAHPAAHLGEELHYRLPGDGVLLEVEGVKVELKHDGGADREGITYVVLL